MLTLRFKQFLSDRLFSLPFSIHLSLLRACDNLQFVFFRIELTLIKRLIFRGLAGCFNALQEYFFDLFIIELHNAALELRQFLHKLYPEVRYIEFAFFRLRVHTLFVGPFMRHVILSRRRVLFLQTDTIRILSFLEGFLCSNWLGRFFWQIGGVVGTCFRGLLW